MPPASSRIFTDDAVASAVLNLIREAQEQVILVSPYNAYWHHLRIELEDAMQGGVEVFAIYRSKEDTKDVAWLAEKGATVVAVDNLHTKLYINESTALVGSMNLTEWSTKNSMEICVRIDEPERSELVEYVNWLLEHGTPLAGGVKRSRSRTARGWCIRCGTDIPLNEDRPLCRKDYSVWNKPQYRNRDYPEKHCHRCGRERSTTFAKPLCPPCYRESLSAGS